MTISKGLVALLAFTTAVNAGILAVNYRITYAGTSMGASPLLIGQATGLTVKTGPSVPVPVSSDGDRAAVITAEKADGLIKPAKDDIDTMVDNARDISVPPIDEAAVKRIFHSEILANAGFILDTLNNHLKEKQAADAADADRKLVQQAALVTEEKDYPVVGNPKGDVEVFYYFDINCTYCKRIDASLTKFVKDNPDVRLVHREMPILTEASKTGAKIGGMLYALHPEYYQVFHNLLLAHQSASSNENISTALNSAAGPDIARQVIDKAFDVNDPVAQAVDKRVQATLDTASKVGIAGTPFIYVKGADKFVRGAAPDLVAQLAAAAAEVRAKAKTK
jgi:protein-disulfide isomerase